MWIVAAKIAKIYATIESSAYVTLEILNKPDVTATPAFETNRNP